MFLFEGRRDGKELPELYLRHWVSSCS